MVAKEHKEHQGRKRSLRRAFVLMSVVLLPLLCFCLFIRKPILAERALSQNYGLLKLGMTRENVDRTFGEKPGLIVHFSERDVLYYGADSLESALGRGPGQHKKILESFKELDIEYVKDLPWVYGYVQILIDTKSDSVLAITMNGETSRIDTALGVFSGSSVDVLPSEIQSQLFGFEQEEGRVEYVEEC